MAYRVEFAPAAERQDKKLAESVRDRITPRLRSGTDDPRPAGAVNLVAATDLDRISVGDYRVVYEVRDRVVVVLVVSMAHRRDVDKDMSLT